MEKNQIITGECLEILRGGEILNNVDLVVTDPPYQFVNNVEPSWWWFIKEQKKQLVNEIRDNFGLDFDPTEMLETIRAWMKKFNWYFFTNRFTLPTYIKWIEKYNYKWDLLLWLKPNPMPIFKSHYLFDKEYCVYIHDSGTTWNADLGYQNYFTYESHSIGSRKYNHPTVKPLEMIERLIKISSNEWDTVLDMYLWSGTTAVACKNTNRNFIGIEINPEYVEIAKKRLEETDRINQQRLF